MSRELQIVSYNIHKGFSPTNRHFQLGQIRQAIRSVGADMVFLQEVVGHDLHYGRDRREWSQSQFEYLADTIWHHHAYGRNAIFEHGHHGNAILSKHPFLHWNNLDISHWRLSQRGVLWGEMEQGIYAICLHLGLVGLERQRQLAQLLMLLRYQIPSQAPVIIAGDFNDWTLRIDRQLKRAGFHEAISSQGRRPARTFPAMLPLLPMDRIYFRNLTLNDAHVLKGNPWQHLSDHCALTATFRLG